MASREFTVRSELAAPRERVWERVSSVAGVNAELRPLARMTAPPDVERFEPETVPIGERLFRSWILLFGVLPIDYDDITLVRVEAGHGFLERSPMLSQRRWEHERTLEDAGGGCRVTDRVRFEPRIGPLAPLLLGLFRAVFRHRHRRLRREFGGRALGA